jgi:hypothetical protein
MWRSSCATLVRSSPATTHPLPSSSTTMRYKNLTVTINTAIGNPLIPGLILTKSRPMQEFPHTPPNGPTCSAYVSAAEGRRYCIVGQNATINDVGFQFFVDGQEACVMLCHPESLVSCEGVQIGEDVLRRFVFNDAKVGGMVLGG